MFNFTPVILKNFTRKKATRPYPKTRRNPFDKARGKISIDPQECILCSICARKCPVGCITVSKKEGFWELDPLACVYCGTCVQFCPTSCLTQEKTQHYPVPRKFTQKSKVEKKLKSKAT
ncbi:4Fe-4S binding protein [Desulfonatronovibrio hydrogenovorans]|uniref:4Fe-4S binding protein n=1 Tax=Desulfonatronovibrio hydrogenovorans TaxID=53245 RepID=UPI00068B09D4|nr:4Fe-4S binding protein [Desulfonatronovibrio hydrogenovorans]